MQAALVPEVPERVGGLAVSVAYRPAEGPAAGGDFYDVFVPERAERSRSSSATSPGTGTERWPEAALTRYTLRAYLQAGLEPRAALALAGQVLADPEAEHFATVVLGVYRHARGLCSHMRAPGHPPPLVRGRRMRAPPGAVRLAAGRLDGAHGTPPDDRLAGAGRRRVLLQRRPDRGSSQR